MRRALAILLFTATQALAQRVPLNDLGSARYLDYQGGLYENGSNTLPADHLERGLLHAARIAPRDGKVVMISIGMSNTTQEFCGAQTPAPCGSWSFVGQALRDPAVNHSTLFLVDGAAGSQTAASWESPAHANYNRIRDVALRNAGATEDQVQVAWVKVANAQPRISLPASGADAFRLLTQMGNIARALRVRYPNIQIAYFSSRIYAGYATTTLNPEPYAYESGLAVKWLVQAQIDQMRNGGTVVDTRAGDLNPDTLAPWIAWGPYLWGDGANPRSDGLIWTRPDLAADGTHPTVSGAQKVGNLLLTFLKSDPTARPWFTVQAPQRRRIVKR